MRRALGMVAMVAASATAALALPSAARAFELQRTAAGTPLRWMGGTIGVAIGSEEGARVEAARAAIATYEDELVRMDVGLSMGTPEASTAAKAAAGAISIEWVETGWDDDYAHGALAMTVTSFDPDSGGIYSAHVAVNSAAFDWIEGGQSMDGCSRAYDLQAVLTHEVGHAFGLAHSSEPGATMYPTTPACSGTARDFATDDVMGLEALYLTDDVPAAGCSVGRRRAELAWPQVMTLLGAVWLWRSRRRAAVVAAALVAVFARSGGATTMFQLSLADLAHSSPLVARGVIMTAQSVRRGDRITTDSVLAVSECMKGECGALLTIRQLGGRVDGYAIRVEGSPELVPGAEVVLFLRARRDGAFGVVGMAQGAFMLGRPGAVRNLRGLELVGAPGDAGGEPAVDLETLRRAARLP